jgi:hypothetical protein
MRLRRSIATLLILVIGTTAVWACECYNNIPIDRTVVPIGAAWRRGDKRFSEFALAIVNERFWGLPWYWPKVVILEGHYPCDNAVTIGKDHLVSGRKLRYGVVDISGCSRTWPIEFAQVDLRTIKGSHCNGPGGTVIGLVHAGLRQSDERPIPYLNQAVTLYDESNQSKRSLTDKDGIAVWLQANTASKRVLLDRRNRVARSRLLKKVSASMRRSRFPQPKRVSRLLIASAACGRIWR